VGRVYYIGLNIHNRIIFERTMGRRRAGKEISCHPRHTPKSHVIVPGFFGVPHNSKFLDAASPEGPNDFQLMIFRISGSLRSGIGGIALG
jgi:hypothetical protein